MLTQSSCPPFVFFGKRKGKNKEGRRKEAKIFQKKRGERGERKRKRGKEEKKGEKRGGENKKWGERVSPKVGRKRQKRIS